ncbi:MAG: type II toxin-antitoxin system VapC family toxin [Bacteroidota bacterium]
MAKEVICVDTSVLIDYYRKKDKSKSRFFELSKKFSLFSVSSVTEFEIYVGSNEEQDRFWNHFFENFIVLSFDGKAAREAAKISSRLKMKNKRVEIPDLMIAATAIVYGCSLATLNKKDFELIESLELV